MDETSQTNAPIIITTSSSWDQNEISLDLEANKNREGNSPESSTNNINNEITEVTEDSFENDNAPPGLDNDDDSDDDDDDDDDSAVEIVDAAVFREQQQASAVAATSTTNTKNSNGDDYDSDEELQCVGTSNETKLPHNRQDCLICRYNNNNSIGGKDTNNSCCAETTMENAKFCKLCYCYVCDKPASECTSWYLGEKGAVIDKDSGNGGAPDDGDKKKKSSSSNKTTDEEEEGAAAAAASSSEENDCLRHYNNHCNSTDKGQTKNLWKNMRTAIKNGLDPSVVTDIAAAGNPNDSLAQFYARYTVPPPAAAAATFATLAEQLRQRQRERHRYRAHATGRGGAHQRRTAGGARDGDEGNHGSIYGSVSMDAANAMDFSSTTTSSSSRRSRAAREPRRTRPEGSNNEQRSRHSNHRDRMKTQAILEDLYS